MTNVTELKKPGMTLEEKMEISERNKAAFTYRLPDMTDAGIGRLAADLGLDFAKISTEKATDLLTGYAIYAKYRALGRRHETLALAGLNNWSTACFEVARLRYERERYNSAKLPTDIEQ